MPQEVRSPFTDAVERLGYPQSHLRFDYKIWLQSGIEAVPVAGFAMPGAWDMSTLILLGTPTEDVDIALLFEMARTVAAPLAVVGSKYGLTLWSVAQSGQASRWKELPYEDVEGLTTLRGTVGPTTLLASKSGARQLSLFPVEMCRHLHQREPRCPANPRRVGSRSAFALASRRLRPGSCQGWRLASRMVVGCFV